VDSGPRPRVAQEGLSAVIAPVRRGVATLAACLLAGLAAAAPAKLDLPRRWIYLSTNFLVEKNADEAVALLQRAAKAGYTGAIVADSKFGRLGEMDARYFRNVDRVKDAARAAKMELVPAVCGFGYSEAHLSQDPDLAEALPVRDALFVVGKGGEARCVADPPVALPGGDFEAAAGARPGWAWKDDAVVVEGGAARVTDPKGNARVAWKLKVAPFRQYDVAVRVKTDDFRGDPRVQAIDTTEGGGGRVLVHSNLGVKPTQDWTEHHAVFNSLDATEVTVYLGQWGAAGGTLRWDDARIDEVGFLNVVRRDGAPLAVRTEAGKPLVEGRDFEKVADPRMGTVPWRGGYEVWHEPPPLRTKLPEGTRLRVSFQHAITVGDGQVMICPSEPRTMEVMKDHVRRVHAAFGAKTYLLSHDEIRVLGWDDACAKRKKTCGQILAENVRDCARLVREAAPGAEVAVWSDMFDPNHNAHAGYYLVKDDLAGSWEGLDKDVIVLPWYFGKRDASLAFFAGRGHRTIPAGYYDGDPVANARGWLEAAHTVPGVIGIVYTTWQHRWADMERFAAAVDEAR
jgi:hypothetical protein